MQRDALNFAAVEQVFSALSGLKAMLTATSGMLSQDSLDAAKSEAPGKPIAPGDDKLPHSSDAINAIAAKAGLGVLAGQNLQLANGETIPLMSGQDTQFATGGQMRVHSGQAMGMLGGAVKAGENNVGLQLVAAKDAIDLQAQADVLNVQARDEVNITSANAHIDWAAAKSISLSTAGGANITITGGNITVQCPGKITVRAGKKSFQGPLRTSYAMPYLPVSNPKNECSNRLDIHDIFVQHSFAAIAFAARVGTGRVMKGTLDEHGRSPQIYAQDEAEKLEILTGQTLDEWDLIVDYRDQ